MARSVRLRPWQKEALDRFQSSVDPDFLAVATPGAGKTTFALTAAGLALGASGGPDRLIVVAPTRHLKTQWATAAAELGMELEPEWSPRDGRLPDDLHGLVVTYQQVAQQTAELAALAKGTFVIFDEIHHAGDDRAWGDAIRAAFEPASRRLALSGTPFRSDSTPIPFVRYDWDQARPDYEYGYAQALADRAVVRPVWFPRVDGLMEWVAPDGQEMSATFEDALDRPRASQRLRVALSLDGEWLPAVLDRAHEQLTAMRAEQPDAGGLVIAIDHEHARGIVELMRQRLGVRATLVLSDDPTASRRIEHFANGTQPWLVAVRMVSEGVDIPRLRVGVYATSTTTDLFFRQAVGRLVRWRPGSGSRQGAVMFIPDDPRLRTWAATIAEQRRHLLYRSSGSGDDDQADRPGALDSLSQHDDQDGDGEQLSLFSVLGSTAFDLAEQQPPWLETGEEIDLGDSDDEERLVVALQLPRRKVGNAVGATTPSGGAPAHLNRRDLRDANAGLARELVALTGGTHAQVNAELNRMAGVGRVGEATMEQLQRRLDYGQRWLTRLTGSSQSRSRRAGSVRRFQR